MARKSRLARLGSSSGAWSTEYNPKEEDWARIEVAYGHQLRRNGRASVLKAVQAYIRQEPFERNASRLGEVRTRLKNIDDAARGLQRALLAGTNQVAAQAEVLLEK